MSSQFDFEKEVDMNGRKRSSKLKNNSSKITGNVQYAHSEEYENIPAYNSSITESKDESSTAMYSTSNKNRFGSAADIVHAEEEEDTTASSSSQRKSVGQMFYQNAQKIVAINILKKAPLGTYTYVEPTPKPTLDSFATENEMSNQNNNNIFCELMNSEEGNGGGTTPAPTAAASTSLGKQHHATYHHHGNAAAGGGVRIGSSSSLHSAAGITRGGSGTALIQGPSPLPKGGVFGSTNTLKSNMTDHHNNINSSREFAPHPSTPTFSTRGERSSTTATAANKSPPFSAEATNANTISSSSGGAGETRLSSPFSSSKPPLPPLLSSQNGRAASREKESSMTSMGWGGRAAALPQTSAAQSYQQNLKYGAPSSPFFPPPPPHLHSQQQQQQFLPQPQQQPERLTNTRLQWRQALNNRPQTCDSNMRDLQRVREEDASDKKALFALIDSETITRRLIEAAASEQRDSLFEKHARRMRYLVRIEIDEQVKRVTVDKQNEIIHNLFVIAQGEEKKKRSAKAVEMIQQRQSKASLAKETALAQHHEAMRSQAEEERRRQEVIHRERIEARRQRALSRYALLVNKRSNAQKVAAGTQQRKTQRERNEQSRAEGCRDRVANSSISARNALPIYSFLRLPPLNSPSESESIRKQKGQKIGFENTSFSKAENDNISDPYGIRNGHLRYRHTNMTEALSRLEDLERERRLRSPNKCENNNDDNNNNNSADLPNIMRPLSSNSQGTTNQMKRREGGKGKKEGEVDNNNLATPSKTDCGANVGGTQTNDDWLDTLPTDSSDDSDDEH